MVEVFFDPFARWKDLFYYFRRRNRDPCVSSMHGTGNPVRGHLFGTRQDANAQAESGRGLRGGQRATTCPGLLEYPGNHQSRERE